MLKYINVYVFLLSFAIGMFMVYITADTSRKIYVYPTPENVDKIQYRDKTKTCFSMRQTEVQCPKDESKITTVKAQN
jgi:hypothetical protein